MSCYVPEIQNDTSPDTLHAPPLENAMSLTITPRQAAAVLGAVALLAGIIALLLPISVTADTGLFGEPSTIDCGSALIDNTSALGGDPVTQCQDALGSRRAWAWPLAIGGLVVAAGALLVASPARKDTPESADTD